MEEVRKQMTRVPRVPFNIDNGYGFSGTYHH